MKEEELRGAELELKLAVEKLNLSMKSLLVIHKGKENDLIMRIGKYTDKIEDSLDYWKETMDHINKKKEKQ